MPLTRPPRGFWFDRMMLINQERWTMRLDLTRCMLQVGPRTTDAALNLASGASNLIAMFSTSSGSNVAPKAVADCGDHKGNNNLA